MGKRDYITDKSIYLRKFTWKLTLFGAGLIFYVLTSLIIAFSLWRSSGAENSSTH